jgi:nudix-type nucleoside diphosphatase (YffH/AdpP family)
MTRKVEIDRKTTLFDDFFRIEEARLRYERFDGTMTDVVRRLSFERGDSVAVVLYNPASQHLLLVNQFKYPAYAKGPGWVTETMAGMIDEGEDPESAARREILEETGYQVHDLQHISTFYVSPGGSSERIVLYYAEVADTDKVGSGGGLAAENEDIAGVELTLDEALEQIRTGEIVDAKTILGIYWMQNHLAGRA